MSWAFTVYESYGTLEEIKDYCLTRFAHVAIYKETSPYIHYHGMLGQCRKGVNDNYKNTIKFLWKLKKTSNFRQGKRMYLCAVQDKKAYLKYIQKMNGIECEGWSNFSSFGIQEQEYWEPATGIVRNWNGNQYGFDDETISGEGSSLVKEPSTDIVYQVGNSKIKDIAEGDTTLSHLSKTNPKGEFPEGTSAPSLCQHSKNVGG